MGGEEPAKIAFANCPARAERGYLSVGVGEIVAIPISFSIPAFCCRSVVLSSRACSGRRAGGVFVRLHLFDFDIVADFHD